MEFAPVIHVPIIRTAPDGIGRGETPLNHPINQVGRYFEGVTRPDPQIVVLQINSFFDLEFRRIQRE